MLNIKNLQSLINSQPPRSRDSQDPLDDVRYICRSGALITESLQKGSDVMQLPNGDLIITELKTITCHYTWDSLKGKLVRVHAGARSRRLQKLSKQAEAEMA